MPHSSFLGQGLFSSLEHFASSLESMVLADHQLQPLKPQTKISLLFFKLFFFNICAQQCKYLTPAPQFDITFWDLVLNISFKINPQNPAAYGIQTCSFSQPMRIRSPVFCLEKVIRNLDFCFPLTHNLPIDFHPISIRWMFASKMKSVLYGRD